MVGVLRPLGMSFFFGFFFWLLLGAFGLAPLRQCGDSSTLRLQTVGVGHPPNASFPFCNVTKISIAEHRPWHGKKCIVKKRPLKCFWVKLYPNK